MKSAMDNLYISQKKEVTLTSVGSETGILSDALDQAPAFSIFMLTESARRRNHLLVEHSPLN